MILGAICDLNGGTPLYVTMGDSVSKGPRILSFLKTLQYLFNIFFY